MATAHSQEMRAKDHQINQLMAQVRHGPTGRYTETRELLRRRDAYADKKPRIFRTEPVRRRIAERQAWKCTNPDGQCLLPDQKLREYHVDHIIPPYMGGTEEDSNLQAMCPGCHQFKTSRERAEMASRQAVLGFVPETIEDLAAIPRALYCYQVYR